jgi:predicted dienelactone hydrolase
MKVARREYSVGSKTIQICDENLDIEFETWLLYPNLDQEESVKVGAFALNAVPEGAVADGRFPLVVISHGGGGYHLLYRVVASYLAQSGFIVAMPKHHGNNKDDNSLENQDMNLTLRTRHVHLLINRLLSDTEFKEHIDIQNIFMVGHSMGGCTALALAGAVPWSRKREKIEVTHDERIKALVLFAPATAWFLHPESLNNVNVPILVYSAEHDPITPKWQANLLKEKILNPHLVRVKEVKNAGHLSFLAPFPERMRNKNFFPSQDPEGFDRESFHETLKVEVGDFFRQSINHYS